MGKLLNLAPYICCGEELARKGMNGLYSVGRGAAAPAALCVLSHTVPNATHTIAWVGKGIVYDTGGLCIKGRVRIFAFRRNFCAIITESFVWYVDEYARDEA